MDISKKIQRIKDDRMVQDIEKDMKEIEYKIKDIKDPETKNEIRDENEYIECVEKISNLKQFMSLESKIKSLEKNPLMCGKRVPTGISYKAITVSKS